MFQDFVKQDTPRLVIMFEDGERFQWGIVGNIPIMTLVGAIRRGADRVIGDERSLLETCPEKAFVIARSAETQEIRYYAHPDMPVDPILGMLVMIENTLVETFKARQMTAQQVILGPDGTPLNNRRIR